MKISEAIKARRSTRKFKQQPVDLSVLKNLVDAARLAPSGANIQPLEYIVIAKPGLNNKVFPHLRWAGYIRPEGDPKPGERPPACIVILVNRTLASGSDYKYDIGASAQNISLSAMEQGLGTCWIGAFNKKLVEVLKIAEDYFPALVIALGYPAEQPLYEEASPSSSIHYHKNEEGILHVPKRCLKDIMHINGFLK